MVIKVQCPSCSTWFPVDTNKVPERGVNARCSVCGGIFRVERPEALLPAVEPPVPVTVPTPEPGPVAEDTAWSSESREAEEVTEAADHGDEVLDREPTEVAPAHEREPDTPGEWVIEREEDIDPAGLSYEPVGTLEEELAQVSRDPGLTVPDESFELQGTFEVTPLIDEGLESAAVSEPEGRVESAEPSDAVEPLEPAGRTDSEPEAFGVPPAQEPEEAVSFQPLPEVPPPPVEPPATPAPSIGAFTFGKRDPAERARRLARVLVSDMIMYNPERHKRALVAGTLKADFADEITKSWKEYVEQVGREVAESTDYWTSALNDVLAKGQRIF